MGSSSDATSPGISIVGLPQSLVYAGYDAGELLIHEGEQAGSGIYGEGGTETFGSCDTDSMLWKAQERMRSSGKLKFVFRPDANILRGDVVPGESS